MKCAVRKLLISGGVALACGGMHEASAAPKKVSEMSPGELSRSLLPADIAGKWIKGQKILDDTTLQKQLELFPKLLCTPAVAGDYISDKNGGGRANI